MLVWPITPEIQNYHAAPSIYLAHLIGHEAEGSLFSLLKLQGLFCGLVGSVFLSFHLNSFDSCCCGGHAPRIEGMLIFSPPFQTKLIEMVGRRLAWPLCRADHMHELDNCRYSVSFCGHLPLCTHLPSGLLWTTSIFIQLNGRSQDSDPIRSFWTLKTDRYIGRRPGWSTGTANEYHSFWVGLFCRLGKQFKCRWGGEYDWLRIFCCGYWAHWCGARYGVFQSGCQCRHLLCSFCFKLSGWSEVTNKH